MERLAVCGWDEAAPGLVHALRRAARLTPVAVGDRQAVRLVRARAATGIACYQHLLEMLRTVDLDAVLIGTAAQADELTDAAARRGADLLLDGEAMDGSALMSAVGAARRHGVALAVLRPALQSGATAFLANLAHAEPAWRPRFLDIQVAGPRGAAAALRTGVALAARLHDDAPAQAMGSAVDPDGDDATAIAAQLRWADGPVATVAARYAPEARLRLLLEAPPGTAEIDGAEGASTLTLTPHHGEPERSTLEDGDLLGLEATRAAAIRRGDAQDLLSAAREAVTLRALEQAVGSGLIFPVEDAGLRANLRVLDGGALDDDADAAGGSAPRRGHLRLVAT